MALADLMERLKHDGYMHLTETEEHGIVGLYNFLFTSAILSDLNDTGYHQRWCFHSMDDALDALVEWKRNGFAGEPEGWHRHIPSGRRREDGDATKETINH